MAAKFDERDLVHVLENVGSWKSLRGRRTFLTGASGFVGRWLRDTFDFANNSLNLGAELVSVGRASLPSGRFDFGIHAGRAEDFLADVELTRRVLALANATGASRLLFTSSGAVYQKPGSDYAHAKQVSEDLLGEQAVIARLFTFVGPGLPLDLSFAVGNFVRDVLAGRPVVVQGDGRAVRSYLYAADLAIWLWTLLLRGEAGVPYDVGSMEPISILELAQRVVANTKPKTQIEVRGGSQDSSVYLPTDSRASTELGLSSIINLDEGIRRMYDWNLRLRSGDFPGVSRTH